MGLCVWSDKKRNRFIDLLSEQQMHLDIVAVYNVHLTTTISRCTSYRNLTMGVRGMATDSILTKVGVKIISILSSNVLFREKSQMFVFMFAQKGEKCYKVFPDIKAHFRDLEGELLFSVAVGELAMPEHQVQPCTTSSNHTARWLELAALGFTRTASLPPKPRRCANP